MLVFLDICIDGDPFERMVFEVCGIERLRLLFFIFE